MSRNDQSQIRCTVAGAEHLPPELAGSDEVCRSIVNAATPVLRENGIAPSQVTVNVTVRSDHLISAVASAGSATIAEQNVGIADRTLNARAIEMLAQAVATQLGKLGREGRGDSE